MRVRWWIRQWRRRRASRERKAVLREFVYLDEVSVYSLIASRLGPIATEFTETEAASLQRESAGSLGSYLGIAKGEVSSRDLSAHTQGSQVLRKSIVQTTFKELYELERDSLALRPLPGDARTPALQSVQDLVDRTKDLADDGWVVRPDDLERGRLLEVEVRLEAEAIFRVSAVFSAFLEIVEETPEMFALEMYGINLHQAKSINRILSKLLVGLVPVRGYAADYGVVQVGETSLIVHRRLLEQLQMTDSVRIHPLYLVGVAEQSLFWKDTRRILFSKAQFRVMCRIAEGGVQSFWTPVKLAHVLETVAPGLSQQMDALGENAFAAMTSAARTNRGADQNQRLMRSALCAYSTLLADHYGKQLEEDHLKAVEVLADEHCTSFGSQKARRQAFEAIAKFLMNHLGIEREPEVFACYRAAALGDAGLDVFGRPIPVATPDGIPETGASEGRFLDCEFIAIYW